MERGRQWPCRSDPHAQASSGRGVGPAGQCLWASVLIPSTLWEEEDGLSRALPALESSGSFAKNMFPLMCTFPLQRGSRPDQILW